MFNEAFSTKYLNNFVRSMNPTSIMLHMLPNNPLHVSYPLLVTEIIFKGTTLHQLIYFIGVPRQISSSKIVACLLKTSQFIRFGGCC